MVMPLRDDNTDRHTVPVVTYALIFLLGGRRAPEREVMR